jgi:hypothetical protein
MNWTIKKNAKMLQVCLSKRSDLDPVQLFQIRIRPGQTVPDPTGFGSPTLQKRFTVYISKIKTVCSVKVLPSPTLIRRPSLQIGSATECRYKKLPWQPDLKYRHYTTTRLHFEPPRLLFEPLKLLNFDFRADRILFFPLMWIRL